MLVYFVLYAVSTHAQQGVIDIDTSPDEAPVISFIQSGTNLTASAVDNNLNAASWQNTDPSATELDCKSDSVVYNSASATSNMITLTEANNSQWYCFKVIDFDDNYGYGSYQVKTVTVPVVEETTEEETTEETTTEEEAELMITVAQADDVLTATANRDLQDPKWQVVIAANEAACNQTAFATIRRFTTNKVTDLSWTDNNKYYCFRLAEADDNYVYASIQVSGLIAPAPQTTTPPATPPVSDNQTDDEENETDDDNQAEKIAEQSNDSVAKSEDDDNKDDDKDDSNNDLRIIGIIITGAGAIALFAIFFLSKRQSDQTDDEDF